MMVQFVEAAKLPGNMFLHINIALKRDLVPSKKIQLGVGRSSIPRSRFTSGHTYAYVVNHHSRLGDEIMSVLIVVAHPDDEVLGCGATTRLLTRRGVNVRSCMLSEGVEARQHRPSEQELLGHIHEARTILGAGEPILGHFPNIGFNSVPHVELVQFIEQALVETAADVVFTHHPGDLNDDHRQTSLACQAAVRLFQRRSGLPSLRGLYYMEIPSSTDWAFPSDTAPFSPSAYMPVGADLIDIKLKALEAYAGVMRPYPHPRSAEVIRGWAAVRGGASGMEYAEAFQVAFTNMEAAL